MAKSELPDPQAKREMLHGEKPVECQKYGDMFFEAQRYNDAIDFYARDGLKDGLRRVKDVALESGDYFLLKRISNLLPDEVGEQDWEKLAISAESHGKLNFAIWAKKEYKKQGALEEVHEGEEN